MLEDLSQGSISIGLEGGLSFHTAKQALIELGKLHALSLAEAQEDWPDLAAALVKSGKRDAAVVLREIYESSWPRLRDDDVTIQGFSGESESWRALEKLGPIVDSMMREMAKGRGKHLTHGDYWSGNILLSRKNEDDDDDDNDTTTIKAILDFQFAGKRYISGWLGSDIIICSLTPVYLHTGFHEVPFVDVIMLLSSSCDANLRRSRRQELFEAYVYLGKYVRYAS